MIASLHMIGMGAAQARNTRDYQARIALEHGLVVRPSLSHNPGGELSIQMSARSSRRISSSGPRAGSSVTQNMLRRSWIQFEPTQCPSPASTFIPEVRYGSPWRGGSIWITSAPISAASEAAKGWAILVPVDTIRTPLKAPNACGTRFLSFAIGTAFPLRFCQQTDLGFHILALRSKARRQIPAGLVHCGPVSAQAMVSYRIARRAMAGADADGGNLRCV